MIATRPTGRVFHGRVVIGLMRAAGVLAAASADLACVAISVMRRPAALVHKQVYRERQMLGNAGEAMRVVFPGGVERDASTAQRHAYVPT